MKRFLLGSLVGLLLLSTAGVAHAQQPSSIVVAASGQLQELVLRDGTRAIGRVEKVEGNRVTFRTEAGAVLEVDAAQVVSAEIVHGKIVDNTYWPEDSNPTRLFFSPTGRTLKKGQAYFGVYEMFVPFVQYGVTDRLSIGGGTPLFVGGGEHPVWFTPKLQLIAEPTTQVSIGVMHFLNIDNAALGIAYAAGTKGTTDTAVTVGLGWAYARSGGHSAGAAVLMLGGEHRVSRRIKLITENYIFEDLNLISGGIRFMGDRLSADVGFFTALNVGELGAAPMVNFVWTFGK